MSERMPKADYVRWCKQRARETYDYNLKTGSLKTAVHQALASLLSDFGKHPETEDLCQLVFMQMHAVADEENLFKFIDGFFE